MCVTVWDVDGEPVWFIGYVKDALNDDEFMVEHLHRVASEKDDYWKYPLIDDTQKITTEQILPCKVDGIGTCLQMLEPSSLYCEIQSQLTIHFKSY